MEVKDLQAPLHIGTIVVALHPFAFSISIVTLSLSQISSAHSDISRSPNNIKPLMKLLLNILYTTCSTSAREKEKTVF